MTADDLIEFGIFLEGALAFWEKSVSEFSLSIWWQAMQPYDIAAIKQAFSRHAMNPDSGQFAPKPADVVRMLCGRTVDSAQVAWSKVDKTMRHVGPYRSVVFDDALIHRVLCDMGGWIQLSKFTDDEWQFRANEFETRYRGYLMRGECPEYPRIMIGISESSNRESGREIESPTLIGDIEKANVVLSDGNSSVFQITSPGFKKIRLVTP